MDPQPRPDLVAELVRAVRDATDGTGPVSAEWSQVATSHAGRIHAGGERRPLPNEATAAFRALQEQMRDDARGAWFSARLEIASPTAAEPDAVFTANYTQRVYWNSDSMLTPPTGVEPVPSDAQWSAELRRNPRAPEFVPSWIRVRAVDTGEFRLLREALNGTGLPLPATRLPGEDHVTFEGALLVRHLDSTYSVDIFDYGALHHLGSAAEERAAGLLAWNYLTSPLPDPVPLSPGEVAHRARTARPGYSELAERISAAGPGGVVTNLAAGVPYDRWGGLDGLFLYEWNSPLAQRSLPPSATADGAIQVGFLANQPVPVQAEFAPAWFDQPGGAIRFRTREPLRDLVRSGALSVITAP